MRNFLFTLLLSLFCAFDIVAQNNWSVTLDKSDGLPGELRQHSKDVYYNYTTPLYSLSSPTNVVRITITSNLSDDTPNGNNYITALSELKIYDEKGISIAYTPSSNADHNTLTGYLDGSGLSALNDNDIKTYFHTMYGIPPVTEYHYIEMSLSKAVSSFKLEWSTRLDNSKDAPMEVVITLGPDNLQGGVDADFALGTAVTSESDIAQSNKLFVLKSNAVKTFSNATTTYTGRGPIYMQCAELGDVTASIQHVVQFIPDGNGAYFVYWPQSKKFLKNSTNEYNGLNGWQYSTTNIREAARVRVKALQAGDFELDYDGSYLVNGEGTKNITVYVGAEMRDNLNSKMKIFTLDKKQALEKGDYNQGYSLPIAFNWSIYNADITAESVAALSLSTKPIAESFLSEMVASATTLLETNGNFDGMCTNGENTVLQQEIDKANGLMNSQSPLMSDIFALESSLQLATLRYLGVKLSVYDTRITEMLANAKFSSSPYTPGTYPESSRTLLQTTQTTVRNAKNNIDKYTVAGLNALYKQVEADIKSFNESLVKENDAEDGVVVIPPTVGGEDCIYVYLKDGGVDAYEVVTLSGEPYIEGGTLRLPLASGNIQEYTKAVYDSCSTVVPELPTMISFKFNNKYNPNLNVDVIADTIKSPMHFTLNSIGKWLAPSFNLSDDRAVAYVDSTLQVSKETRVNFSDGATYIVTYPGYNKLKSVKIQDEVWSNPEGSVSEIALTASMLSTNKPSTEVDEGLENLLDNDPYSIFHSTWGEANNATINVNCYIAIDLPKAIERMQLYYKTRSVGGYNPLKLEIYVSNDGDAWTLVRTLTTSDGMPTGGALVDYTSPTIELGGKYEHIKILQTQGEYSKNHMALSELKIYEVQLPTEEPEKIQDAVYANVRLPFGREYKIVPDWLTDKATSVPRIDIDIDGGLFVTSKDYYLNANFRITGYGVFDDFEDSVQIKGRGNSTWSHSKKPYRLKFDEKVKPFGLTKGKSWVLLANAQTGALLANAIAMKAGQLIDAPYTNHIIPVELYMNGRYLGNYMFTEKVGMANNSVDIDETLGYMLELDDYYDENYKFKSNNYNLPVNVKEPDLTEYSAAEANTRFTSIKNDFNEFETALYNKNDIEPYVDMDALARFIFTNELVLNQELGHPKSTYLWKEDLASEASKIVFGPLWDFDWGFGYESTSSYCYSGATSSFISSSMAYRPGAQFFGDIVNNQAFKKYYYKVWQEFIEDGHLQELLDYVDDYYKFSKTSFEHNATEWGDGNNYAAAVDRAQKWLSERYNYLVEHLDEYDISDLIHTLLGDVSCNDVLTIEDVTMMVNHLLGHSNEAFSLSKADIDKNGRVNDADLEHIVSQLLAAASVSSIYYFGTPVATAELSAADFEAEIGEQSRLPIALNDLGDDEYIAYQMDVKVPAGLTLVDIMPGERVAEHNFSYNQITEDTYRVVAYSDDNNSLKDGDAVVELLFAAVDVIPENNSSVAVNNVLVMNNSNTEQRLNSIEARFGFTTAVSEKDAAVMDIRGGKYLLVTLLDEQIVDIYSVDGRLVQRQRMSEGTTRVELQAGVYVVCGKKVVIY